MTKSTITRERLEQLADNNTICKVSWDERIELAQIALAAMDSEPVAVIDLANLDYLLSGADADVWPPEREEMGDVLLYRHAQPAPTSPVCTCPSGDGSLRWPCPAHPGNSPVIGIDLASGPDRTVEVRYVAPPGYVMVPKEPTVNQWAAGMQAFDSGVDKVTRVYKAMLAAAQQDAINALIPLVSRDEQEGK